MYNVVLELGCTYAACCAPVSLSMPVRSGSQNEDDMMTLMQVMVVSADGNYEGPARGSVGVIDTQVEALGSRQTGSDPNRLSPSRRGTPYALFCSVYQSLQPGPEVHFR